MMTKLPYTDDVEVHDPPHRSVCRYCCPAHDALRAENERLRAALAHALYAIDMIMTAQQPLPDSWFAERDACIKVAREALGSDNCH